MLENIRFSSTILNGRLYFLEYIIAYMFLNVFFDGRSVPSRWFMSATREKGAFSIQRAGLDIAQFYN